MEKTGAERVKYSLACQHEDAIPIKFVPYAQKCPTVLCTFAVALRKESVDRNYRRFRTIHNTEMSLSARRAWIEILIILCPIAAPYVALRKESVDRNPAPKYRRMPPRVALRKESVDRNQVRTVTRGLLQVALRKESVDRNTYTRTQSASLSASLSARRAWIEISIKKRTPAKPFCRSPQGERG